MNYRLYFLSLIVGAAGSFLYIISCMPETISRKMGEAAFEKCKVYRRLSSIPLCASFLFYFCYNLESLHISLSWLPVNFPYPIRPLVTFPVSLILLIIGLFCFIKGRKARGIESDNPKEYHGVVDTGVYKYIRHPQLLGEICLWYFVSFLWASPLLVLTTTLFWLPNYILWCHFEEKDLILRFGDEYLEYKKRTKFMIPFIL